MPPSSAPRDPAGKMVAAEVSFFAKALAGFAKSGAKFEVVCSVSRRHVVSSPASPSSSLPSPLVPPARQRSQIHSLVILDSSFNPPTRAHMKLATSALLDCLCAPPHQLLSTRLLLLLSVNNADKAPKPASFAQRLVLMLALARDTHAELAQHKNDRLDIPIDIGLTSEPYFHHKSNAIAVSPFYVRPSFPSAPVDRPTPDQLFLLGYDTLIRLFDPKYYPPADADGAPAIPEGLPADATPMQIALTPLLRRARLRVTTRPDDQWGDEVAQRAWVAGTVDALGGPTEQWASRIQLDTGADPGTQAVSSTVVRAASQTGDTETLRALVGPAVLERLAILKPYSEAP
ncbi:cytidylyltransferase [Sporothrix schenckii 1099-18]|uniref:Nicotinamide-nucleotide adenylyltransferase n=2 Tax=Sporothrix schenckii TaxID=29908 RepID=U7PSR3_SPOS1|nr:cytidylyltransferase [Sporothrix schenckii 1099-18]ERS97495.1 hypothetical protein HMPREF1624_05663 [Sporothrix schenckii ATCC 58251]KJR82003.1 cytidylyltransferase [Sporothrix schenckii 1099-18]